MKKYTLHVISNTHWDREWRHSFQRMRMDLVELMDRLLDICEKEPDFKHYHLDSQTIPLEDYLEVRPEKRSLLSKHIRGGKILVGPWYTLPDMFLVSAEAVVRNLMRGHRVAAELGGKAMKVGYTPTSYGQVSQMAQIYKGFDIDSIIFYRGLDAYGVKKSEYILEAPDGTRILGIKPTVSFTRFLFRWKVFSRTIRKGGVEKPCVCFHPIDTDSHLDGYSIIHTDLHKTFDPSRIADGVESAKAEIVDMATTEHLLMMDGFDASLPHQNSGKICAVAKKMGVKDTLIHQSFPEYIAAVRKSVDWNTLQVLKGQRRTPARDTGGTSIMQGVLTSHSYFKRANHDTQILLEKYAEPISAFAWLLGAEYRAGFINLAWKYLLSTHPHDTICGASVDQIYSDAMDRLKQAQMIAQHTTLRAERDVVTAITNKRKPEGGQILTVFNSLPFERTEVVEAFVDFPREDKVADFALEDFDGKPIPYQALSKESLYGVAEHGDVGYPAYYVDQYKIAFTADAIPPLGYKCFRIRSGRQNRALRGGGLAGSPNTMENDFLKVSINKNGTLDLTDKTTKRTYGELHYFEDGGDAGTPWYFTRPNRDRIVTTLGSKARIRLVENKPMSAVYRVKVTMKAPEALTPDKTARMRREKTISFTSFIRLTSTSRYVDIATRVDTPAEDHRLRMVFPTGLRADRSCAESNFDIAASPIEHPEDSSKWIDKEQGILPQQSFVDLTDGKAGLAILNRGLREYEVSEDERRAISLTLVRGIRYPKIAGGANPATDDPTQVRCQCKGTFEFNYAVYPHEGDWRKGNLYRESRRFNVPMRLSQCGGGVRVRSPRVSFLTIEPEDLILSALKRGESGKSLIVRFFNPTTRTIKGSITTANEIKRVRLVNLNEEPLRNAEVPLRDSRGFDLEVPHKKIVTLELFVKR